MNISKATEQKIGEAIAKHYLNGSGFGKMNKNDFEVLIFYILRNNEYNDVSNFELSVALKLAESKVKRLDYEGRLIYGEKTTTDVALLSYLSHAQYDKGTDKFKFVIENKFDRAYLDAKVKSMHSFIDTSFNSEIVTISKGDLVELLKQCYSFSDEDRESLVKDLDAKAKKELEDSKGKIDWTKVLQKFVEGLAEGSGNLLIDFLGGGLSPARIICKSVTKIIGIFK